MGVLWGVGEGDGGHYSNYQSIFKEKMFENMSKELESVKKTRNFGK